MGLGGKMLSGALWSFVERISTQAIQVILGVVLARLLTPKDYGLIGLMTVFIVISQVFVDSGFARALIQKKDRNDKDISTVFVFNLLVALSCYVLLWLIAPLVSDYYDAVQITNLLRVLALSLITNAFLSVPTTLAIIDFKFNTLAKVNVVAVVFSGVLAVCLAYSGWGVWALVYQTLSKSFITSLLLWYMSKWRPVLIFSKTSFRKLFSYGFSLLISSLLNVSVGNISSLLIGKYLSPKALGYYTQGVQYPTVLFGTINAGIDKILLPGLAGLQDQREILTSHMKRIIKTSMVFVLPVFMLLLVLAEPLTKVFLTEKWLPIVPVIQIFAIARAVTVLSGLNVNLLYVIGRTDLALRQDYFKIPVRLILILGALKFGIVFVALAELASTLIHYFINSYFPGKIMSYGAKKQLRDIGGIMAFNAILVAIGFAAMYFIEIEIYQLVVVPVLFLISFLIWTKLFNVKEAFDVYKDFKNILAKK